MLIYACNIMRIKINRFILQINIIEIFNFITLLDSGTHLKRKKRKLRKMYRLRISLYMKSRISPKFLKIEKSYFNF